MTTDQDALDHLIRRGVHPDVVAIVAALLPQEQGGARRPIGSGDRILTPAEFASFVGVSARTVSRLADAGKIKRVQISPHRHGFRQSEVERFLKANS